MNEHQLVLEWFMNNLPEINKVLTDMDNQRRKLLEIEPKIFHDDVNLEYYDKTFSKLADLATNSLAIPTEMVYNVFEDKKLLIDKLNRNLKNEV